MASPSTRPKRPVLITDVQLREMVVHSTLCHQDRSTILFIAHALYRDTLKMTASYDRLAGYLGLGRRQTIVRIQALENLEVLVKLRAGGGRQENGRGCCNMWMLDLEVLQSFRCAPPVPENPEPIEAPPVDAPPAVRGADGPKRDQIGALTDTVNGARQALERCTTDARRVNQTAHDPTVPMNPKKETNNPLAHAAGGAYESCGMASMSEPDSGDRPREPRPKKPRFGDEPKSRADRLAQLRAQAELIENGAGVSPVQAVELNTEGGD
jgi:hypothetical protein